MNKFLYGFIAALAFLTRLAPGAQLKDEDLAQAMAWMPVVGAVIGLICVGPIWLGILNEHPYIAAWLVVILAIWLTRALHLDGLSDVMDGLGSHLDADAFWEIIKDSRVGSFGVVGLVMALLGLVLLLGELFAAQFYGPALWVFIVGRCCALTMGFFGKHLARPGLGQLFLNGATLQALFFGLTFTALSGLLLATPLQMLGALIGAAHFQFPLLALARRVKGLNGDFLGASIIAGELGALIGILIAS